jgi:glycosyltransferase involved in cell wall biosynthesis
MTDPLNFPAEFHAKKGRPLRVLHIGNVANYAYVNAKLMRQYGIETAVADPDFYHIMATPEWHEADVSGDHVNDWHPKWGALNLNGYVRPDWVVQGRSDLVWACLAARATGNERRETYTRKRLNFERRVLSDDFSVFQSWFWRTRSPIARLFRGPYRIWQNFCDKRALHADQSVAEDSDAFVQDVESRAYISSYRYSRNQVRAAIDYFDIVIGYTISGIVAAANGFERTIAYELGTLRGLPWEDSDTGRLTAWLYRQAPEVFVTNVDCITHGQELGIEDARLSPTLHAYDLDHMRALCDKHAGPDLNGPPILFAPARHHWHDGNPSWLKGNDVYIKALGVLARKGHDFRLITVDWGSEVELSKKLIKAEGFSDKVTWVGPMSRVAMARACCEATAVIDQFNASAFGGVALDTMIAKRRLVTRYDEQAATAFFSSAPPIDNVHTQEEVTTALEKILADPFDKHKVGEALRAWMYEEHGVEKQLKSQFSAFGRLLEQFPLSPYP